MPRAVRYLKDEYPDMFMEIDLKATLQEHPNLELDKLNIGSKKKIHWKCPKHPQYSYRVRVDHRTANKINCTICTNRQIVPEYNSFAWLHPELTKQQHPESTVDLFSLAPKSDVKCDWLCVDCGSTWNSHLKSRVKGLGCPQCGYERSAIASSSPREGESISDKNPQLALEWHPTKNTLTPNQVCFRSNNAYWWQCVNGHEWRAIVNNRHGGNGCVKCTKHGTSKIEARFRERLQAEESLLVFPFEPFKPHYTFGGYGLTIDIFFQAGEGYRDKYVVEYDGYYHNIDKARKRDIRKTNALLARGFKVIRIRENNLTHLDIEHENLLQLTYRYSTSPESLDPIVKQMLDWIELNST